MKYEKITVPADGQRITINPDSSLNVPDHPYIAYVEGDRVRRHAEFLRELVQAVGATTADDQARAVACEALGDGFAESGRGTADEDDHGVPACMA